MRYPVKLAATLIVVALVLVLLMDNAYAYLDPGTGSYILQLLIAGVLGGLFAIKVYWAKLKAFMMSRFGKRSGGEEET